MPKTFDFPFSELPLLIENGVEAGLINGSAEISYFADGVWSVESVSLEGYRPTTSEERVKGTLFVRKPVTLAAGTPLHLIVVHRPRREWADQVAEAVNTQLEEDRASAPDNRADRRREGRAA